MSSNEVTRLIISAGAEMGRSADQMEPIVRKIVNEEWFDTLDSLRSLSDEQWARLNIPARLVDKLKEKLAFFEDREASETLEWTRVETAPPLDQTLHVSVADLLESLAVESAAAFIPIVNLLAKIVNNILLDLANPKYRQLKVSNPKLKELIFSFPSAVRILEALGFSPLPEDPGTFACKTVYLSRFTDVQYQLGAETSSAFNPFKASIVNAGDTFGAPKGNLMTEREAEMEGVRQEVAQLRAKQAEIRTVIEKPRLVDLSSKISNSITESSSTPQDDDTALLLSSMRSLAAAGESAQKFRSRERLELEKLKARQSYPTTKVRILFGDRKALELTLSSGESISGVYKALSACLQPDLQTHKDWVLTITPPLRRLERDSRKTLAEEDFVPSVSLRMMHNSQLCNSFDVLQPEYIL